MSVIEMPIADSRVLAAALESAVTWLYARDLHAHIKIGVPPNSGWSSEYVADVERIRKGVAIAKKLGFPCKAVCL